jgi:hypothetical protein
VSSETEDDAGNGLKGGAFAVKFIGSAYQEAAPSVRVGVQPTVADRLRVLSNKFVLA